MACRQVYPQRIHLHGHKIKYKIYMNYIFHFADNIIFCLEIEIISEDFLLKRHSPRITFYCLKYYTNKVNLHQFMHLLKII